MQCDDDDLPPSRGHVAKLFLGLNGTGYGRCDIRMNAQGELFMLEINPNCDVAYPLDEAGSADLILMHDRWGHRDFFEKIIRAALKRQQRSHRKWHLLLDSENRYGMYAREAILTGDVIEPHEEQAHVLVSEKHVRQTWNAEQQNWFAQYAYPLTDEVFVVESRSGTLEADQSFVRSQRWLEGMDLVARRK